MTWKRAGSAMSAGAPKSAMASRNSTMNAPMMAGSASGRVTRRVVRRAPAPRVLAASSISEEIRSRAERVNTNMYGNE